MRSRGGGKKKDEMKKKRTNVEVECTTTAIRVAHALPIVLEICCYRARTHGVLFGVPHAVRVGRCKFVHGRSFIEKKKKKKKIVR